MSALHTIKAATRGLILQRMRWPGVYEAMIGVERALFGRKIRIETCSKCQLACPSCSTGRGDNRGNVVGWGSLSAKDFDALLDRAGRVRRVELSSWGELFLNREIVDILRRAHERGVAVEVTNGANLNSATEEMLDAVVRYGMRQLSVSIDGASDATYSIYRKNGDFNRVLRHVDRIVSLKRERRSRWPHLIWQFIVFGHNEHEIPAARRMAQDRGMTFNPIPNLDPAYSPVRDAEYVHRETGIRFEPDQERIKERLGKGFAFCNQFWDSPQINWDGRLLGCCFNNVSDFGNVLESDLATAMKGERYRYAKRMLLGLEPARADIACSRCPLYAAMGHAGAAAPMVQVGVKRSDWSAGAG